MGIYEPGTNIALAIVAVTPPPDDDDKDDKDDKDEDKAVAMPGVGDGFIIVIFIVSRGGGTLVGRRTAGVVFHKGCGGGGVKIVDLLESLNDDNKLLCYWGVFFGLLCR